MANSYYAGRQAVQYNQRWQTYTQKTLAAALSMIDFTTLNRKTERARQTPRVLDVACGTGILLQHLLERNPSLEAYGVDGSKDMLAQARIALKGQPGISLQQVDLNQPGWSRTLDMPGSFDLITATNLLHDIGDPATFLTALHDLLEPGGQLVLEDFAPRRPLWLWKIFEKLLQRAESVPVRALGLDEVQLCCEQANLRVLAQKKFVINWFWHGWTLYASRKR